MLYVPLIVLPGCFELVAIRSPVWCATTTTTCRLVMKLRRIAQEQREPASGDPPDDLDMSPVADGDYDELVRSGVHIEMLRSVGPSTPMSGWHY